MLLFNNNEVQYFIVNQYIYIYLISTLDAYGGEIVQLVEICAEIKRFILTLYLEECDLVSFDVLFLTLEWRSGLCRDVPVRSDWVPVGLGIQSDWVPVRLGTHSDWFSFTYKYLISWYKMNSIITNLFQFIETTWIWWECRCKKAL